MEAASDAVVVDHLEAHLAFGLPLYADFSLHASIFHGGK
jgi:hypothetical protein